MRYLIVDGHSVIFAWPDLAALHRTRATAARHELERRLARYQDASGVRVVLVFDGRGSRVDAAGEPEGIQVFYSRRGQTADSIIERLCARYAQQHELTVASDDHMERQTAISFGASTISTQMLRGLLGAARSELERRLREQKGR